MAHGKSLVLREIQPGEGTWIRAGGLWRDPARAKRRLGVRELRAKWARARLRARRARQLRLTLDRVRRARA